MENIKLSINKYHYGQSFGKWDPAIVPILKIASVFYFIVISFKNLLYSLHILKEKSVKPFVICVGNLTTGGVGKTPIVCEIADFCTNTLNKKTAVISRGYGAKLNNKNINVIKNENGVHYTNGAVCGDEALLIAKNTNKAVVLTCRDRVRAAKFAHKNCKCDVVILDDGFSNRKIKKDFAILVLDSKKQFGNSALLPAGPLREPLCEAKRADYVIIANKESNPVDKNSQDAIAQKLKKDKIALCNMEPESFYNIKNSLKIVMPYQKAGAFCAIGQSEQFYEYLNKYFELTFSKSYVDHHTYTKEDIGDLIKGAKETGASILVTTQKDEVKIKPLLEGNPKGSEINFMSLKLALKFEDERLFNSIEKEIKKYESKQHL